MLARLWRQERRASLRGPRTTERQLGQVGLVSSQDDMQTLPNMWPQLRRTAGSGVGVY